MPVNSDPRALEKLARVLEEACLDVAELLADVEETREQVQTRALALRDKLAWVSKSAGLGELAEYRIDRKAVKVS